MTLVLLQLNIGLARYTRWIVHISSGARKHSTCILQQQQQLQIQQQLVARTTVTGFSDFFKVRRSTNPGTKVNVSSTEREVISKKDLRDITRGCSSVPQLDIMRRQSQGLGHHDCFLRLVKQMMNGMFCVAVAARQACHGSFPSTIRY